jgi:hypothetical protein
MVGERIWMCVGRWKGGKVYEWMMDDGWIDGQLSIGIMWYGIPSLPYIQVYERMKWVDEG